MSTQTTPVRAEDSIETVSAAVPAIMVGTRWLTLLMGAAHLLGVAPGWAWLPAGRGSRLGVAPGWAWLPGMPIGWDLVVIMAVWTFIEAVRKRSPSTPEQPSTHL